MKKDALFCVGQKAFIEKGGKVLVLNDHGYGVDFPGGKIQEGEAKSGDTESLINSLKREVREETSLEIEVGEPFAVWYHEFAEGHRNFGKVVYCVAFRCKYVSGEVKLSTEHDTFKWVDKNDYKELDDNPRTQRAEQSSYDGKSDYYDVLKKYFYEN